MKEVRAIRSQKQYLEFLSKVNELMDADPNANSDDGKLLETLAILIEEYERKRGWEIPLPSDPVQVIQKRMAALGLKQSDLSKVIGDKAVISRILNRSRKLTYSMVMPLSKLLRVPPEFLLEKEAA
jgi:HTH-type transcriptional regulator / antitoxin HigA